MASHPPSTARPITSPPPAESEPGPPGPLAPSAGEAAAPTPPGRPQGPGTGPAPPRARPLPGMGTQDSAAGRGDRESPGPSGVPWPGGSDAARLDAPDPGGPAGRARLEPGAAPAVPGAVPPEYDSYVRALRQRVQERLVYPWAAVHRGQQGVVELEVRVGAEGRLAGVEVVAGPGTESLRAAAVAAVRGAAPFPFPPGVEGRALVIRLPVEFRLR
jgi:protein TonB